MNYYPFHVGDYKGRTSFLTPMQDLAYRRLLDVYYMDEKPLVGTAQELAEEIGLSECATDVERVLNKFFVLDGKQWRNKRADIEISAYHTMKSRNSEAGKASAKARAEARKAAKSGSKQTTDRRASNRRSTTVERPLNDRATKSQPTSNQEPGINSDPSDQSGDAAKTPKTSEARLPDDQRVAKPGAARYEAVRLALVAWNTEHGHPEPTIAEVKRGLAACGLNALLLEFGQDKTLDLRRAAEGKWGTTSWQGVWTHRHALADEVAGKRPTLPAKADRADPMEEALAIARQRRTG